MEHCEFCGAEVPVGGQFCGSCGRARRSALNAPTSISGSYPPIAIDDANDNRPTTISKSSRPDLDSWIEGHDTTIRTSSGDSNPNSPTFISKPSYTPLCNEQHNILSNTSMPTSDNTEYVVSEEEEEEEERRRRALLMGLPLLGALEPPVSNVPVVQGTPQPGSVPMVPNTPNTLLPPTVRVPSPHTPLPESDLRPPTWQQPQTQARVPLHQSGTQARPSDPTVPNATARRRPSGTRARPHGSATTWLIFGGIILMIIGSAAALFVGSSPTLSISGSSSVSPGELLHLHGSNFIPSSHITLTLDESGLILFARPNIHSAGGPTGTLWQSSGTALQMAENGQGALITGSSPSLSASITGRFDATIPVSAGWGAGQHTIHAKEDISSRSTTLKFTVRTRSAALQIQTSLLNFDKLEVASKAVLSMVLRNSGGLPLNWSAHTGAAWLNLQPNTGTISPGTTPQFTYVTADTSSLKVGKYTTTIVMNSNGGNAQVSVALEVIPHSTKQQATLNVTPTNLDFGTLSSGNQVSQPINISNTGNAALNWKTNSGNASWLGVDTSSNTIQAGGRPQTINVTVDTISLSDGSYSANLSISSNGGTVTVTITMVVSNGSPPPPTVIPTQPTVIPSQPTVVPTTPTAGTPPTLSVSPGNFDQNGCSGTPNAGYSCTVTLSENADASGVLAWTVSDNTNGTIQYNPSSNTLSPPNFLSEQVTMSNMPCQMGVQIDFHGPNNDVIVNWNCTLPPSPSPSVPATLHVNPTALGTGVCSSDPNGGWDCTVTLLEDANATSPASWTVSNNLGSSSPVTYSSSGSTLQPGGSMQITIYHIPCATGVQFYFTGPVNTAQTNWDCIG